MRTFGAEGGYYFVEALSPVIADCALTYNTWRVKLSTRRITCLPDGSRDQDWAAQRSRCRTVDHSKNGTTASSARSTAPKISVSLANGDDNATDLKMMQPEMSDIGMGRRLTSRMSLRDNNRARQRHTSEEDDISQQKHASSIRSTLWKVFWVVVPHTALMCLFFLYLTMGAFVFNKLEAPQSDVVQYRTDFDNAKIELFAMVNRSMSSGPWGTNAPSTRLPPQDAQARTSGLRTPNMSPGDWHGGGDDNGDDDDDVIMAEIDGRLQDIVDRLTRPNMKMGRMDSLQAGRAWSFSSSMLFCMTTITTIGYGDIVPSTKWGRIFCIIYSIFGIPLALLCLANIGNLLARLVLKICRIAHYVLVLRRRIGVSCRNCRRRGRTNPRQSSSRRTLDNGEAVEIEMGDQPPEYTPRADGEKGETNHGANNLTADHSFMRSVSIATECPTSHPGGVTIKKQSSAEVNDAHLDPIAEPLCNCKPDECQCDHKTDDLLEEVPLFVVLLILVVYMCLGAALMSSAEGWDYGTGIYFMFITVTTIGFGDVLPIQHYAANTFVPCIFFTLFGLAVMSMCIALVQFKLLRAFQLLKIKLGLCS